MALGLASSYGTCGYVGFEYLRSGPHRKALLFVTNLAKMVVGDTMAFELPSGAKLAITRQQDAGAASDFIALSSTCPHLGCQVHWQAPQKRFFCPCHNGTFDASGKPTGGPPKADGTPLLRYPLVVENGLLFVEVDEAKST